MQNIAAAWLLLHLTGSPGGRGRPVRFCQFLPFTLFSLRPAYCSTAIDPRRVIIVTQALSLVFAVMLAGITLGGDRDPWMLYVLAAARGMVLVVDNPGRQALTFQLVGRDELPNAVALNSSLFNGARVIGPGRDDEDRRADLDVLEEPLRVGDRHADAAVRGRVAERRRVGRAVDADGRRRDSHPARAERVARARRDRLRVLRPVGVGRVPRRVALLDDDLEVAERRRVRGLAGRDGEALHELAAS